MLYKRYEGGEKMPKGIDISRRLVHDDECKKHRDKDCGEMHKFRVANATLKIAIDVHTDFDCDSDD